MFCSIKNLKIFHIEWCVYMIKIGSLVPKIFFIEFGGIIHLHIYNERW